MEEKRGKRVFTPEQKFEIIKNRKEVSLQN